MKVRMELPPDAPSLHGAVSLRATGPGSLTIRCADGPQVVAQAGQTAHVWAWRNKLWKRRPKALRTRPIPLRWWLRRGHTMPPLFGPERR